MTATIRATCDVCGTVDVSIEAARLVVALVAGRPANVLEFRCPRCATPRQQEIAERATRLLSRAGVTLVGPAPVKPYRRPGARAPGRDTTS